ncbi:hypothetical protein [Pseudooceanicola sp.]|uniref:hypothetical protein n=1 Tax=Pseudooceanicola sp. TaxID=1914328 RepID=UPI004059A984
MTAVGHLGLPLAPEENSTFTPMLGDLKYFAWWSNFLNTHAEPQKTRLDELLKDQRFLAVEKDFKINDSEFFPGADRLGTIAWWAWRANEVGTEIADAELSKVLDNPFEQYPMVAVSWVAGITCKMTFDLGGGINLVPTSLMPENQFRRKFMSTTFDPMISHYPQCALTAEAQSPFVSRPGSTSTLIQAMERLTAYELLIGAVGDHHCFPVFNSQFRPDNVPYGPEYGYGLGHNIETLPFCPVREIKAHEVDAVRALYIDYIQMEQKPRRAISLALDRLRRAKCQRHLAQKAVDLAVALESALLFDAHGNKGTDQLSLTFRLRAAWLIGKNPEDRVRVHNIMRKIYDYRSKAIHTGDIPGDKSKVAECLETGTQEACRIISELIRRRHQVDWSKIVLGG